MEKLDRLVWAAGLAFESYGVRVGVRVDDAGVLNHLTARFPPGWKAAASPVVERLYSIVAAGVVGNQAAEGAAAGAGQRRRIRRFGLLYADAARIARTHEQEMLFDVFESDLHLYVAEAARRRLFVHAGVVGWRGRAVLIPGRSFTGKSTLVAELVRAGADYYSDEYAVLDRRGRVHPYARPLGVRETPTGRQRKMTADDFGGVNGERPLPIGAVVLSEYRKGALWRPREVSGGRGVLALLANTVSARRQPEEALNILRGVAGSALFLKGVRGEAACAAASILETLSSS